MNFSETKSFHGSYIPRQVVKFIQSVRRVLWSEATVESPPGVPHTCVRAKKKKNGQKNNSETNCSLSNITNNCFDKNIATRNILVQKKCRSSPPLCAGVDIGTGVNTTIIRIQNTTTQKFLAQYKKKIR